jgi:Zn finger protein HypA/HybF involved in hydrogenase expression
MDEKETRVELECSNCDAEYIVEYDLEEFPEEPAFCPFCGNDHVVLEDAEPPEFLADV